MTISNITRLVFKHNVFVTSVGMANTLDLASETPLLPPVEDNLVLVTSLSAYTPLNLVPPVISQSIFYILSIFQSFQKLLQTQTSKRPPTQLQIHGQEMLQNHQQLKVNLGMRRINDLLNSVYNLGK